MRWVRYTVILLYTGRVVFFSFIYHSIFRYLIMSGLSLLRVPFFLIEYQPDQNNIFTFHATCVHVLISQFITRSKQVIIAAIPGRID